jgi:hypothetical protein
MLIFQKFVVSIYSDSVIRDHVLFRVLDRRLYFAGGFLCGRSWVLITSIAEMFFKREDVPPFLALMAVKRPLIVWFDVEVAALRDMSLRQSGRLQCDMQDLGW